MSARLRAVIVPLAEGTHILDAETSRYLARSLRLRSGDAFVAFDPTSAREADAEVASVERGKVGVRIGALRGAKVVAERAVAWVQGFAKGEKMDAIVRDATELGATKFVPAMTEHSVVRLDGERAATRRERWERISREAARQCGRGDALEVCMPCPWAEALDAVTSSSSRFCLWENADEPMGPALLPAVSLSRPLAFAAGPEGGLSPGEVALARDRGWTVVSLGAFVLRTETVVTAVLGAARVLLGAV
jgi:16S rRNA (uracil1498-N3)-methyltransferase